MKISLGPLLYCWEKNTVLDFYEQAKLAAVESIYLGETVCSKRKELLHQDWLALAQAIAQTGKEVVISTLALVESPSKLNDVKRAVNNGDFVIEANDFSAVELCAEQGLPFIAGPALNCYNAITLRILLRNGMRRWCMPVELSRDWLYHIVEQAKKMSIFGQFEIEVFSYGYLPLAYSARCFTARAENKTKSNCEITCLNDPNGRALYSQDQQRLFTMNGIQTQSGDCYQLINALPEMQDKVDYVRISPLGLDTLTVIEDYRAKIADPQKTFPLDKGMCDGYWYGQSGMYNTYLADQLSIDEA